MSAAKQSYDCFVCRNNGHANEKVTLGGKDENGKTIYLEVDGVTPHHHKPKASTTTGSSTSGASDAVMTLLAQNIGKLSDVLDRLDQRLDIGQQQ